MASPRRQQQQSQGPQVPDLGSLLQLFSLFQPNAAQQGEQQIQQQHLGLQQQQVGNEAAHQKNADAVQQMMLQLQQQQAGSEDRHRQSEDTFKQMMLQMQKSQDENTRAHQQAIEQLGQRQAASDEGRNNIASMDSAAKTAMEAQNLQLQKSKLDADTRTQIAKTFELTHPEWAAQVHADSGNGQAAIASILKAQSDAQATKVAKKQFEAETLLKARNTDGAIAALVDTGKTRDEAKVAVAQMMQQLKPAPVSSSPSTSAPTTSAALSPVPPGWIRHPNDPNSAYNPTTKETWPLSRLDAAGNVMKSPNILDWLFKDIGSGQSILNH